MTRLIELPQEFEKIAAAEAQKHGKSLEEYLLNLVAGALTPPMSPGEQSSDEYTARFQRTRHGQGNSRDAHLAAGRLDA